jgi:hypothetical protein
MGVSYRAQMAIFIFISMFGKTGRNEGFTRKNEKSNYISQNVGMLR